jgi:transposase
MSKTKPKTELLTATMANEPLPTCPVAAIKRYDENFRKSAVEHWIKTGQPGTQIATELGISYPSLKEWKRRYHGDALPEHGNLELENRTLRAELARVREQRDILKKTLGIFTEPPPSVTKSSKP